MGGDRGSTARARLAGEICCWCGKRLHPPERPGGLACEDCAPAQVPRRRFYKSYMQRLGWYCQFLEEDLKTPLPLKLSFADESKVCELAQRAVALQTSKLGMRSIAVSKSAAAEFTCNSLMGNTGN